VTRLWIAAALVAAVFLLWRSLRRRAFRAARGRPEQALRLELRLPGGPAGDAAARVAEAVARAARQSGAGVLDESAALGEALVLYLYGPDAGRLHAALAGALRAAPLLPGSRAVRRAGPSGSAEETLPLP
jgi:hypothetical protein